MTPGEAAREFWRDSDNHLRFGVRAVAEPAREFWEALARAVLEAAAERNEE